MNKKYKPCKRSHVTSSSYIPHKHVQDKEQWYLVTVVDPCPNIIPIESVTWCQCQFILTMLAPIHVTLSLPFSLLSYLEQTHVSLYQGIISFLLYMLSIKELLSLIKLYSFFDLSSLILSHIHLTITCTMTFILFYCTLGWWQKEQSEDQSFTFYMQVSWGDVTPVEISELILRGVQRAGGVHGLSP